MDGKKAIHYVDDSRAALHQAKDYLNHAMQLAADQDNVRRLQESIHAVENALTECENVRQFLG